MKSFFEQWLTRLMALGVFTYLAYSLFARHDEFSWLHIATLAIAVALVLAPMAGKLKVLDLIHFSSKLDELAREQQETKTQLNDLRNEITTVVSTRVSPTQIVSLQGIRELISSNSERVDLPTGKGQKYTKEEFLQKANGYRHRAFVLLLLTLSFQIALKEHRERPHNFRGTMDEIIKNSVNQILENDLRIVFRVPGEKSGEADSLITPDIIDGLKKISSLVDLYQKIRSGDEELPSQQALDDLFNSVFETLITLSAGLEVLGVNLILYRQRVEGIVEEMRAQIGQADIE